MKETEVNLHADSSNLFIAMKLNKFVVMKVVEQTNITSVYQYCKLVVMHKILSSFS